MGATTLHTETASVFVEAWPQVAERVLRATGRSPNLDIPSEDVLPFERVVCRDAIILRHRKILRHHLLLDVPLRSSLRTPVNDIEYFPPNFEGLVLGCIDADFCK